jgi:hypothetical protein
MVKKGAMRGIKKPHEFHAALSMQVERFYAASN